MRGPAGGDAPDNAVKQETDLLSFWTGQEENTSPWKMEGERDQSIWWISKKKKHDGMGENYRIINVHNMKQMCLFEI